MRQYLFFVCKKYAHVTAVVLSDEAIELATRMSRAMSIQKNASHTKRERHTPNNKADDVLRKTALCCQIIILKKNFAKLPFRKQMFFGYAMFKEKQEQKIGFVLLREIYGANDF